MKLIINVSIICIVTLLLMQYSRRPRVYAEQLSGRRHEYSRFLLVVFGGTLTFAAAFRQGFVDTQVYKSLYQQVGGDWDNAFNETIPIEDYGFSLLMIFLNRINSDPQTLVIVTSVITLSAYFFTFGKYAEDLPFSLLLYLCMSYMDSMNGIRQVLAGAILTLALPWVRDRKTIPYLLLVWLLSTLHASIIVMIPIYFIISGKRLNWGIWLFAGAVVACFAAPSVANQVMGAILEDSIYADYLENESKMGFMRFLVALVPAGLAILYCYIQQGNHDGENKLCDNYKHQRMIDVLINMQIVTFGFTALGMQMVYFARISMYFTAAFPLLLPTVIQGTFNTRSAKFVKNMAIVMYLFYYAYQIYSFESYGYFYDFHLNF